MAKLTDKQQTFCEEYLVDLNATQAAIRAGYSEKTANEQGSQLLAKLSIQETVQNLMDERSKRTEITADNVLQEIAKLGFSNMLDYVNVEGGRPEVDLSEVTEEQAAAITEFTIDTRYERGRDGEDATEIEKVRFKLADKGINLERLGRHLKLFTDKREIDASFNINIGGKDADTF